MNNSLVAEVRAQSLVERKDSLIVDLSDGRSITVPLAWYPRLVHGRPEERNNWRWIGDRKGIHWPDLDEDISVENLILGKASGESQDSFRRGWKSGGSLVTAVDAMTRAALHGAV